ncbi:LssY C-terminal domain-containing protein [Methylomagnum sp.]
MNLPEFHTWILHHPHLAGVAVFLIAMAESLAGVGLIVPGVAMMFGTGALIGTGALSFGPTCAYAVAGAITGDGLSFWFGWHFRDRLASVWPFTRYPGLIPSGMAFVQRYGGRSLLFGRFVGPMRGITPLVAGMLAMPVRRFLPINVLSSALWAPAYLIPGMVFGASLELASRIAGRLAILLAVLVALLWFTAWLSKRLYGYFRPRAHAFILFTFEFCKAHPLFGRLTAPLIDPSQRDYAGLLLWAVILVAIAVTASALVPAGAGMISLEAWRNPIADRALAVGEDFGETPGVLAFAVAVGAWLLIRGQRIAAAHGLVGLGFAAVVGGLCHAAFPVPLVDGPVLNGAVAYGFAAVLLAGGASLGRRWLGYVVAALWVVAIAFARLYFGAVELAGIGFTLVLALVWLVLLGVAYRRHAAHESPTGGLAWVAALAWVAIAAVSSRHHAATEFPSPAPHAAIADAAWRAGDWRRLPAYRVQLFGRPDQPLAVQWAAPLETIRAALAETGWREAKPPGLGPALRLLNPDTDIADLPVLPHLNQADMDALRMIKPTPDGRWLIVRFWPSGLELADGAGPIWLGSVAYLEAHGFLGLVKFSEETGDGAEPARRLAAELRSRHPVLERGAGDHRAVILIPPEKR